MVWKWCALKKPFRFVFILCNMRSLYGCWKRNVTFSFLFFSFLNGWNLTFDLKKNAESREAASLILFSSSITSVCGCPCIIMLMAAASSACLRCLCSLKSWMIYMKLEEYSQWQALNFFFIHNPTTVCLQLEAFCFIEVFHNLPIHQLSLGLIVWCSWFSWVKPCP